MLEHANHLMRKVWSQLEVSCREEGVKRFMVEASTEMSPVKEKQKTAFQQARTRVVKIMKEEEEERKKEVQEKSRKVCDDKKREEENDLVKQAAVVPQPPAGTPEENVQGASANCSPPKAGEEPGTNASEEVPILAQDRAREEEGEDSLVIGSPADEEVGLQLQGAKQSEGSQVPSILETLRVKDQKWTPPQGHRRCSGNCLGCQRKCKDLGLDDCQSCHLNKVKNTNSNGCCNRDACTNLRVVKVKKIKNSQGDESLSAAQPELSQVDSIVNDFEKKGVDKENKDTEEILQKGQKRNRDKGGTPEDMKRSRQIARTTGAGGTSKLIAPRKSSLLQN